jgi:hypothetical protein
VSEFADKINEILNAKLTARVLVSRLVEGKIFGDIRNRDGDFITDAAQALGVPQSDVDEALALDLHTRKITEIRDFKTDALILVIDRPPEELILVEGDSRDYYLGQVVGKVTLDIDGVKHELEGGAVYVKDPKV